MFHKILVPIDGSPESLKAVEIARAIAEGCQITEVTLLHVLVPVTMPNASIAPGAMPLDEELYLPVVPEILELQQQGGEALVAAMKEKFAGSPVTPETKVVEGHASGSILDCAKDGGFDLIVIGSRGRSGIGRFLMGSISDAVVHHAHCPVLVVR